MTVVLVAALLLVLVPRPDATRLLAPRDASEPGTSIIDAARRLLARRVPSIRRVSDGSLVVAFGAGLLLAFVALPLVFAPPIGLAAEAIRRERFVATRRAAALTRSLPELIDLLALSVGAGLTLPDSLRLVGQWLPPELAAVTQVSLERLDMGATLIDALGSLSAALPDSAHRSMAVIVAATRDGAPLGPNLARAADEARRSRRRSAEVRARRLPVLMLLPLVSCVLPAFVLLTLVPVVLGSLDGLSFPTP